MTLRKIISIIKWIATFFAVLFVPAFATFGRYKEKAKQANT